jgi:cytochrome c oxidase subunit 3
MSTDVHRNPAQTLPPQFVGSAEKLPMYAHSHRSVTWWGMMGLIAVEGTAFALACAAYLYLANQVPDWPPAQIPPFMSYGVAFTAITVLSVLPNIWLHRNAEAENLLAVRIGLIVMSALGLLLCAVRYFEFEALNVSWSDSAYGSIVVTLLGLHTVHLVTDLVDTIVLAALMFTQHGKGRRFVDVAENAIYWNFVVLAWIPIWLLIYFAPGWL